MSAWLVKTRHAPSQHCRDPRGYTIWSYHYGHALISSTPPPVPMSVRSILAKLCYHYRSMRLSAPPPPLKQTLKPPPPASKPARGSRHELPGRPPPPVLSQLKVLLTECGVCLYRSSAAEPCLSLIWPKRSTRVEGADCTRRNGMCRRKR